MAAKKIQVTLRCRNGRTVQVKGERADVAPHLPQTFVIHRPVEAMFADEWWVSEASTGCRAARGFVGDSKSEVLQHTREKLATVPPERMEQVMAHARKLLVLNGHVDAVADEAKRTTGEAA